MVNVLLRATENRTRPQGPGTLLRATYAHVGNIRVWPWAFGNRVGFLTQ